MNPIKSYADADADVRGLYTKRTKGQLDKSLVPKPMRLAALLTTLIPLVHALGSHRHSCRQLLPGRYPLAVDDGAVERPLRTGRQNKGTVGNAVEVAVLALCCHDDDGIFRNFDGTGCSHVSFSVLSMQVLHPPDSKWGMCELGIGRDPGADEQEWNRLTIKSGEGRGAGDEGNACNNRSETHDGVWVSKTWFWF